MDEQEYDRQNMQQHGADKAPCQSLPVVLCMFLHALHVRPPPGDIQWIGPEKVGYTPILFERPHSAPRSADELRNGKINRHNQPF